MADQEITSNVGGAATVGTLDQPTRTSPESELNPFDDKNEINKRIDRVLEIDRKSRWVFERDWFRNVLIFAGQHWIIFDSITKRWRPKRLPAYYPRLVTNKFAEKANDLVAVLVGGSVPLHQEPMTDNADDVATAELGERLQEVLKEEAKTEDTETDLASWVVLTGNGFLIPYYDPSEEYGTSFVQALQCQTCGEYLKPTDAEQFNGACPYCASQGMTGELAPAAEPDGTQIGYYEPIGSFCSDVCSPFEIRLDPRVKDITQLREYIRVRTYDVKFAKEYWKNFAEKIHPDKEWNYGQFYLDALAFVSSSFGSMGGLTGLNQDRITAFEYFALPSEKFPNGIRAVRLGASEDLIVEVGELPNRYGAGPRKGKPFLNLIHFGFDKVPGRFWRKTRMDDLVPLQFFRNTIESNIQLTVQRMGNAVWLNPKGSGATSITGTPGQVIDYNPVSFGGTSIVEPKRLDPALNGLQPLAIMLNKIDDSMERVAGTFFLQGGDTPPGVTAASALAYLGERAERSMSPLKREWAKSWKRWMEAAIEIFRQNATDSRIRVIAGKNKRWQTEKFRAADLKGAVNIKIDYNGLFPKSQATERAQIAQLIQLGVINPQDPEQQWRILETFGETSIKSSTNLDVQEAVKENDAFLTKQETPRLFPLIQNSMVHLMVHADFMKTDEFKELPPEDQAVMFNHYQETIQDVMNRQQMLGQMTAVGQSEPSPSGAPPGVPPDGSTVSDQRGTRPYGAAAGKEEAAARENTPAQAPLLPA